VAEHDQTEQQDAEHKRPVIVAIGASTGGTHALQSFFSALPDHTGAAFVVVVHLDPQHHSEMPQILATRTHMPVVQVGDRDRLEADHVYVIPPDRRLQLIDGEILARRFDEPRGQRAPIDLFLLSLAEQLGDGFAVILTGAGSDGTLGVRAVKEAGGIILVQDPDEAEYASMPRSAIGTGVADFVMPVRDLAKRLTELIRAKERVTVRAESDAANEELRAANEELQSLNEEHRSTSEELETSKEELQSINEELQTVNSELKLKLETISRAHSDLQNLIAANDIGTLFLDSSLRVKRFTDKVTDLFSLTAADQDRPITDFAHQLDYQDLVKDARAVLADLTPIRRETRSRAGRWYEMRLRPYRTIEDKIDGVVITFIDITDRRQVDEALRVSEESLRQDQRLVELSRDPIFIWDFDGGIVFWNRGSEELYGYSSAEAIGKRKDHLLATQVPGSSFAELRAKLLAEGGFSGEVRHHTKDGRELSIETRIVLNTQGGKRLALESTRDVTERKEWEKRQQLLLGELAHRVRNTLAVVQAIAHQSLRTSKSSQDFVERFDGRLTALASSHSLLVNSDWLGADLATLTRSQMEPYTSENPDRVRISGQTVTLPADLATPFGLILHELATNAAKHGALSRRRGSVAIKWTLTRNDPRVLKVVWREQGGPKVQQPTTSGFGSVLIENGVPGATVKREFKPAGLICTIELPLPKLGEHGGAGTH
jgi:two-component system CheB/CheR fusion protein